MKIVLTVLVSIFGALSATDADANAACGNNSGLTPKRGAVLPPQSQVLVFDTDELAGDYIARINGKEVSLDTEDVQSGPFHMKLIKINSDATGKLKIYELWPSGARDDAEERLIASYTIKKKVKVAQKVTGKATHFFRDLPHSTVKETYDALAIDLGGERMAIKATVKLRRDARSEWQTLEVPVVPGDWLDKRTAVRVGQLGCQSNYSAALLHAGVELEVSLLMVDGSEAAVELPARYQLPAPPASPAQP